MGSSCEPDCAARSSDYPEPNLDRSSQGPHARKIGRVLDATASSGIFAHRGATRSRGAGARFCARRARPARRSLGTRRKHFPVDVMRKAAALGMGGIYVREDVGGSALTRLDAALIFEALATGCPSIAAYHLDPQHGSVDDRPLRLRRSSAGVSCRSSPRMEHARQLLPDRAGRGLGRGGARDPRACATATPTCSTASKQFISGAGASDLYVVMARTGGDGPARHLDVRGRERHARPVVRRQRDEDGLERPADPRR